LEQEARSFHRRISVAAVIGDKDVENVFFLRRLPSVQQVLSIGVPVLAWNRLLR